MRARVRDETRVYCETNRSMYIPRPHRRNEPTTAGARRPTPVPLLGRLDVVPAHSFYMFAADSLATYLNPRCASVKESRPADLLYSSSSKVPLDPVLVYPTHQKHVHTSLCRKRKCRVLKSDFLHSYSLQPSLAVQTGFTMLSITWSLMQGACARASRRALAFSYRTLLLRAPLLSQK